MYILPKAGGGEGGNKDFFPRKTGKNKEFWGKNAFSSDILLFLGGVEENFTSRGRGAIFLPPRKLGNIRISW